MHKVILLVLLALGVSTAAALTAKVSVVGRDGSQVFAESAVAPKTLTKAVAVNEDEVLHLAVSDAKENDVLFALFSHSEKKGVEASFALDGKKGKLSLQVDPSKKNSFLFNKLKQHPGSYSLSLLASSDPKNPVKVGTVNFILPSSTETHVLGSTESFEPLKEIFHQFRQPEKMPPIAISYLFSAAVVVIPWGLLLLLWASLKANVSNLTASTGNLIWGSSFLLSLAASCFFFYVYWVQLNLFQLFGYGSAIWSLMALLGRQALVSHADLRLKQGKAAK